MNINFEELKQKAIEAITLLSDKAGEVYSKAEGKTKEIAKVTQLNAEIAREKSNVKKLTAELGALYYQLYKDDPTQATSQLVGEITNANSRIEALQKQIEEVKAAAKEEEVEVEFVAKDECCCEEKDESCCCETAEEPCCCEEKAEPCCCEEAPAEEKSECCCEEKEAEAPEEAAKDDCACCGDGE